MRSHPLAVVPFLAVALFAQGTPEVEPNASVGTATALAPGAQGDGAIGVAGDVDLWRITLPGPRDLRCWLNPGRGASIADPDLTLLAADGVTELAFSDDVDPVTNWLSRIVVGNLAAGDYYLRVRSSQRYAPGATGAYTIDAVAVSVGIYVGAGAGAPLAVAEAPEENDPRRPSGTATSSHRSSRNSGAVAVGGGGFTFADPTADFDFYAVVVTAPGTLTLATVAGASAPACADTCIFLCDGALAVLAADDDSGDGGLSRLVAPVVPGTYYAVVKGYGPGSVGNYRLDVAWSAPVPMGAAAVTVRTGGCGVTLGTRSTPGPVVATEVPVLGSAFYLDGRNLQPNAALMHVIGIAGLAQPFDLGAMGAPGCAIEVQPFDQSIAFANVFGVDFWGLSSPVAPAFIGLPLEQQIVALDPAANALGVRVSNRVSSVFGVTN